MKIISIFFYLIIQACYVEASQITPNVSTNEIALSEGVPFDDLSIIVFSCDKYQELWSPFFEMLFKSWPSLKTTNAQIPIYLVANAKKYDDPRVITVNNKNEKSWSDNALAVLASVKTKYVWIILEDYFFTRIDEKRLLEIFNFVKSEDVAYCQVAYDHVDKLVRKNHEVHSGIAEKDRYEPWRTSLFPCIWRTKDMAHTLKSGESIWEFEIPGTQRSQGLYGKFLTVFENQPVEYLNMVQMGYLNSQNFESVINMGISFKRGKLEFDSDHKLFLWYDRTLKPFLYYVIWTPVKNFIKKYLF